MRSFRRSSVLQILKSSRVLSCPIPEITKTPLLLNKSELKVAIRPEHMVLPSLIRVEGKVDKIVIISVQCVAIGRE